MKQLKKQGRYIILKRRICAFKVRADFENKRKTEVYYGFYNGHTGADRVCSQCGKAGPVVIPVLRRLKMDQTERKTG